ncbi:J domain-containing protein [Aerophototrophica crusticola]|uniref:J domain-containing protein n=1 Tax=Aerophototrophica crusticola TaxID=1709002 RepID=UPI00384C7CB7
MLGLDPGSDFATVKRRYRELAKKHHPDANGGSKQAEERLKTINQAYNTLKASLGAG